MVGKSSPINLWDVKEIHRHLLGFISPQNAGRVRTSEIWVGKYSPPPPGDFLDSQLQQFDKWLQLHSQTQLMHPVELAALAHFRLVHIHPFVDGNGRTARLLLNLLLIKSGFPPIVIDSALRHAYYRTLEFGHDGDARPFVRFVQKHVLEAIEKYLGETTDEKAITSCDWIDRFMLNEL